MLEIALGDRIRRLTCPYGGKDVTYPLLLELEQAWPSPPRACSWTFGLHAMMQLVRRRAADPESGEPSTSCRESGAGSSPRSGLDAEPGRPRDF